MLVSGAFNLIMAGVWLAAGLAILIADPPSTRIWGFSIGWFLFVLTAWNLVRWWSLRSAALRRREVEEMQKHRPARRSGEPEPERNPDFIFDEPKPEPPAPFSADRFDEPEA